jgi:Flp pilus assembly protein TadD
MKQAQNSRMRTWLLALAVACVTFVAFVPALGNQFLEWDDLGNIVRNEFLRGLSWDNVRSMFTTFMHGHYQPLTWLSLAMDYTWSGAVFGTHSTFGYGFDPRAFHLTNNVIHAINAALVYVLALYVLRWTPLREGRPGSWADHLAAALAALLFSVHPLRVENVAWITERRDVLSCTFLLLTVLAYLRAVALEQTHRWRWILVALALYALSLMAKVSAMSLPVVLIALDWYPLGRLRGTPRDTARSIWLEKALFFIAAIVFAGINILGQRGEDTMFPLWMHPLDARIVQCFYGLAFYLYKTAVPFNLLPLYELHMPMNISETRFIVAIAFVLVVGVAMTVLMVMRRLPRGLVVVALCYAAFLGPVLGLFQNGPQLVADRYSYLPGIGLSILIAAGVVQWLIRPRLPKGLRVGGFVVCGLIIAGLGVLTWRQCRVWYDNESLWSFTVERDPNCAMANDGIGIVLVAKGEPNLAVPYFQKAVQLDPNYWPDLRVAYREAGRMDELVAAWLGEARVRQSFSHLTQYDADYHFKQGNQALSQGKFALAQEHFLVVLALKENNPQAHHNLAAAHEYLNRPVDAEKQYRRAIELDGAMIQSHQNLVELLLRQNRPAEAVAAIEALLRVDPANAQARALRDQLRQAQ